MDRKRIYEDVKDILYKNWGGFVLAFLIIGVIGGILNSILDGIFPTYDNLNYLNNFTESSYFAVEQPTSNMIIKSFISSIITSALGGALSIAILKYLRNPHTVYNRKFSIDKLFEQISLYPKELFIVALVLSVIITLLGMVPIVGFLLIIIASLVFAFVYFAIVDVNSNNLGDIFRLSVEKTNGRKLDIVLMFLKYYLVPIIVMLGCIILVMVPVFRSFNEPTGGSIGLSILVAFLGIIASAILFIRASIQTSVAMAVMYDYDSEVYYKEYEDDVYYDDLEDRVNNIYTDEDIIRDTNPEYIDDDELENRNKLKDDVRDVYKDDDIYIDDDIERND